VQKLQVEQPQDAVLVLRPGLVMVKVEGVNAGLRLQARAFEAAFNGAVVAGLQFHIGKPFQRGGHAEVPGGCLRDRRLQLAAHRGQAQLVQLLGERHHIPFRNQE